MASQDHIFCVRLVRAKSINIATFLASDIRHGFRPCPHLFSAKVRRRLIMLRQIPAHHGFVCPKALDRTGTRQYMENEGVKQSP